MGNYNFRRDLQISKKTEEEVAGILAKIYSAEIEEIRTDNKYDIKAKIDGSSKTFEVKEDFMCVDTGNVAVEYSCRGKLSGISTSEADFYIYKLETRDKGIHYIMHKVSDLKQMIERKEYFREVNGGDRGSNSLNYLFKYNVFAGSGFILPLDKTGIMWYNGENK